MSSCKEEALPCSRAASPMSTTCTAAPRSQHPASVSSGRTPAPFATGGFHHSIMTPGFAYVQPGTAFPCLQKQAVSHCMPVPHFVCPFLARWTVSTCWLLCQHTVTLLGVSGCSSLGCIPSLGFAGSYGNSGFNCLFLWACLLFSV